MTEIDLETVQTGTLYIRLTDGSIVRANVLFTKLASDDEQPSPNLLVWAKSFGLLKTVKTAAEN